MRATLPIVALAACGYPPLAQSDGGNHSHMMSGDGGAACDAPSDYGTMTAGSQVGQYYQPSNQGPGELDVAGTVKSGSPGDYLLFVLVADDSQINGNDIPNTANLTFDMTNFANCGICGAIFTAATSPLGSSYTYNTMYVATAGSISLQFGDTTATAMVTNAVFSEAVYTDPSNPNDLSTQLVSGGCTTKVDSISFNVNPSSN